MMIKIMMTMMQGTLPQHNFKRGDPLALPASLL